MRCAALAALRRFRGLCRVMHVGRTFVVATAACREADNGPEFIARAERIFGTESRFCPARARQSCRRSASSPASTSRTASSATSAAARSNWSTFPASGSARRQPAARRPCAAGHVAQVDQARRAHRQGRDSTALRAEGRSRAHVLCGRRHLARAGAAAHLADRLSAARDARLCDPRRRGAGLRPPGEAHDGRAMPESRPSPTRGARCSPMRRWCWSTSSASPSRRRS